MPRGRGKVVIEVSRELRDRIRELAEEHGLLYEDLIWKALDVFTQSKSVAITQSNPPVTQSNTQHTQSVTQSKKVPVDCTARRAKKGDKPLNVYLVECRDGAKAIVPGETLADLTNRFKLKIEVVD